VIFYYFEEYNEKGISNNATVSVVGFRPRPLSSGQFAGVQATSVIMVR
jgi:hypothetical protein